MSQEYITFDDLESLSETDKEIDGAMFRIRAAELTDLLRMQSFSELLEHDPGRAGTLLQGVLYRCVVKPEIPSEEDVSKLGRFLLPLFMAVMDFSSGGLNDQDVDPEELEQLVQ